MLSRRLPVYLLLDVSGSMSGAPIEAVNEGLQVFAQSIKSEAPALETIHVSIITFGGSVNQLCSMVPAGEFTPPRLTAVGSTPMGEALFCLDSCIDSEVRLISDEDKADYKPLVFLFTDGYPTDGQKYKEAMIKLERRTRTKLANIIGLAAGPDANLDLLKEIGGTVLRMTDMNRDTISEYFAWVSQSAVEASCVASAEGDKKPVPLLPPPPCIEIML